MITRAAVQQHLKVLIIEDNPTDFKLMRRMLRDVTEMQFEVEWQDRLGSGIERIRKGGIDVVLLDLSLPDSYWSDTFERLKSISTKIPIIVMSGFKDIPRETLRRGAEDYLIKGETNSELFRHAIVHAVERHKLKRQLNALNEQMKEDLRQMENLLKLDLMINTTHELDQLFDIARKTIPLIFHTSSFSIYLYNSEKKSLACAVCDPADSKEPAEISDVEPSVLWSAIRTGEPYFYGSNDPKNSIVVPLITENTILGVLNVEGLDQKSMTPNSLTNIQRVSNHLSLAIYNARVMKKVQALAVNDELTGLYNRRYFYQDLGREVERVKRHGSPFSVLMADIDKFKKINDTFGHPVGDRVLRKIAEVIRSNLRPNDVAYRWGGDEFMVILPQTKGESAAQIMDRLRQILAGQIVHQDDGADLKVTVSLGLAEYRPNDSIEELIKRVDAALYQAKKSGRNNTVLH